MIKTGLKARLARDMALALAHISYFNERVAVWMTDRCGTMWVFYLFALFGLAPALPALHAQQGTFLYIGNVLQLCALPLIMVGSQVIGRAQDKRACEDHNNILREMEEIKAMHAALDMIIMARVETVQEKVETVQEKVETVQEKVDEVEASVHLMSDQIDEQSGV